MRREVIVHIYESVEALREAALRHTGEDHSEADGLMNSYGYRFSEDKVEETPGPLGLVMLHVDRLTVEVIAHEMTHAAMHQYFSVNPCDPLTPVLDHMDGGNESVAYFVGAWTAKTITELHRRGYSVATS